MLKPERTHGPESDVVFFAMPFGTRDINGGESCNFDTIYSSALAPTVEACGMKPERLDSLYGPQGVLELIWWALQRAEIVVIDFTLRNSNVTFEYGLAWTLGKRVIAITQDPDDIPSDVRGLNRYIRYSQHFADIERMKDELKLQLEALRNEPADERAPMPYNVNGMTTIAVPVTVAAVTPEYALVQTDDGRFGVLRNGDVTYERFFDMSRRYSVGDSLDGAFIIDAQRGEARYTLLAGQTNPWTVAAHRFPVGTAFTGIVRNHIDGVGLFVALEGTTINGLVSATSIDGPLPLIGDPVEVIVTRMDPVRRRVSLRLRSAAGSSAVTPPLPLPPVGHQANGTVTRTVPEENGRGGFILLELPGYPRPAMLLAQHMSEDLRTDLNNRQVDLGEQISIEVTVVDPAKRRVLLREIEPLEDAA